MSRLEVTVAVLIRNFFRLILQPKSWFILFVALMPAVGSGQQSTTGVPPLGTFVRGDVDAINVANLNNHVTIPIIHKKGLGLPFDYSVNWDSSIWSLNTIGNKSYWELASNAGWNVVNNGIGFVTWAIYPGSAGCEYYDFAYVDAVGTWHNFTVSVHINSCNSGPTQATGLANDGSGFTINVTAPLTVQSPATPPTVVLHDESGSLISAPVVNLILGNVPPAISDNPASITDRNGNTISTTGTVFTDTLGTTVLSISGASPNPVVFTYTGPETSQYPNGIPEHVTVNYKSYTVATNFGCGGTTVEYPPTATSLVSSISLPDGTSYGFTYEQTPGSQFQGTGDVTGRISEIDLPSGGSIQYTYPGSNDGMICGVGAAGLQRTTLDGTWKYSYTLGSLTSSTTVTDPANNDTVYTIDSTGLVGGATAYQGSSTVQNPTVLRSSITCYSGTAQPCSTVGQNFNPPPSAITYIEELPGGRQSETVTYFSTGTLLPTEVDHYDYTTAPVGTPGPLLQKTLTTYANLGTILDMPSSITVEDANSHINSQTTYTNYDSNGNVGKITSLVGTTSLSRSYSNYSHGLPETITDVNGASTSVTYGACNGAFPTQINLALGLSISMEWDCNGAVLTQITDPSGGTTKYGYGTDPFWRVVTITDPIGNETTNTYSAATGSTPATIESVLPVGTSSAVDVLTTMDALGRAVETQRRQSPGSTNFDSVQLVEGFTQNLGKFLKTSIPFQQTASTPGGTAFTTKQEDALGRPATVTDAGGGTASYSYPQNDTLTTLSPAPSGENTKSRQMEYDALGRLTSVCEILSSGGSACSQNTTASGYKTSYAYSVPAAGGSQMVVTQGVQTRTYVGDGVGRRTSETNPESANASTYIYDSVAANYCAAGTAAYSSAGDLVAKADANGNHICNFYDALHRLTDTGNNAQSGTNVCKRFRYDNVSNGIVAQPSGSTITNVKGRLVEAETDNCVAPITPITDEWFSYDADGNMTDMWELTPHSGQYYHSVAAFFANGKVNTLQLASPSLYTMTYGVDGEGRWNTLTDTTTNQKLVMGATFPPAATCSGSPCSVVSLTGTDNDTYTFDPNTWRMTQFVFTVGSQNMTGNLNWNSNSTLKQLGITDGFNAGGTQTCNYLYDDLARLGVPPNSPPPPANPTTYSVDCGSTQLRQVFSYDQYGNLTQTGNPGTTWNPGYSAGSNHCSTCTYDADGNVKGDGNDVYGWDVYSKLAWTATSGTPTCGTSGRCATYDAFGRMVEQSNGSTFLERWITPLGETAYMSGATPQYAYWAAPGGQGKVLILGTSSYDYLHYDWDGNPRIVSGITNHTAGTDQAYSPFGELYDMFGSNSGEFKTFGTLTGDFAPTTTTPLMWDTPNRELSMVGRWLSPDPAGLGAVDFANPQSWNRYSYVGNQPLTRSDPSGLVACCANGMGPNSLYTMPECAANEGCINIAVCNVDGLDQPCNMSPPDSVDVVGGSSIFTGEDCLACLPRPSLYQSIWSDVLGLPSGLNCPQVGGISNYLCGGVSPFMDEKPDNPRDVTEPQSGEKIRAMRG